MSNQRLLKFVDPKLFRAAKDFGLNRASSKISSGRNFFISGVSQQIFGLKKQSRQYATSENGDASPKSSENSSDDKSDHLFNDGHGRSSKDIVGRIACLQLILARWGIEAALQSGSPAQRIQASHIGINQASKLIELQDILTSKEKNMLLQPLGKWTQADLTEYEERWEEFGIFQWCLGIQKEVPSYFEEFPKSMLFMTTGMVPGQPASFVNFLTNSPAKVIPRSQDEIKEQLTQAEVWHWRSQAQTLLSLKDLGGKIFPDEDQDEIVNFTQLPPAVRRMIDKLPQAISHTASLAHSRGFIFEAVEEDFGVHSSVDPSLGIEDKMISYRQLGEHALGKLSSLAQARYHALAFLSGAIQDYDDPLSRLTDGASHGNVLGGLPHLWAPENEDDSTEK